MRLTYITLFYCSNGFTSHHRTVNNIHSSHVHGSNCIPTPVESISSGRLRTYTLAKEERLGQREGSSSII